MMVTSHSTDQVKDPIEPRTEQNNEGQTLPMTTFSMNIYLFTFGVCAGMYDSVGKVFKDNAFSLLTLSHILFRQPSDDADLATEGLLQNVLTDTKSRHLLTDIESQSRRASAQLRPFLQP